MAFMGELKPFYGKWNWPIGEMQPGDSFIVDKMRRPTDAIRSYVSMAAVRKGKYFSIRGDDPDHPGYTVVTCTLPPMERSADEALISVVDGELFKAKFWEWYRYNVDEMPWGPNVRLGKRIDVEQVKEPLVKRVIYPTTDKIMGTLGFTLDEKGFDIIGLDERETAESWLQRDEDMLKEILS